MTGNGDVPSGAGGVNEPDWIDQILERATRQADSVAAERSATSLPIVPDEAPVSPRAQDRGVGPQGMPEPAPVPIVAAQPSGQVVPPATPQQSKVEQAQNTTDQLAEIRWADEPQVTPASTPIVRVDDQATTPNRSAASVPGASLTPADVGRSAWDEDLAAVGNSEPEGWEKLSWQDLDGQDDRAKEIRETSSFGGIIREWGPVLFSAVAIALFIRLVIVQAYHIPSPSMVPTLENGDRVVVNRLSYRFGDIERGQVVVFEKPANTEGENDLIKRVLALPGETIRFVDNQVYIDGLRVEEPYLLRPDSTQPRSNVIPGCAQAEPQNDLCQVPEGYVFVMGDNRDGSSDSRVFGPIPTETVVGRAFLRVWPLNNIGQL